MKHVFRVAGLRAGDDLRRRLLHRAGRSKHLSVVAPRVSMQAEELDALVPRRCPDGCDRRDIASRHLPARVSGIPTSATMEAKALEAAAITEKQRVTARQATIAVLSGARVEGSASPLKDC